MFQPLSIKLSEEAQVGQPCEHHNGTNLSKGGHPWGWVLQDDGLFYTGGEVVRGVR